MTVLRICRRYRQRYLEVLANTSDSRFEACITLPGDTIVQHIEQDDSFIPDCHIGVAKELDEYSLQSLELGLLV